jgi:hypothetical protein
MARFSRRPSPSLGGAFRKALDLSLYAGVRLIPVTGTSHEHFRLI